MSDLRHALRLLKKDPGFTVVALVTLGLGIGANVAIFSIVNAVLLRPLPYAEPEGIMRVAERAPFPGPGPRVPIMTNHTYEAWRDEGRTLAQIAAYTDRSYTFTGGEETVRLQGAAVTASLFPLLRVAASIGRTFDAGNEQFGASRVVVLGESLWERLFGRDPTIVGRSITLDGEPHEILGVVPAAFRFPNPNAELWTPFVMRPRLPADARPDTRMVLAFSALARLNPGLTPAQAEAEGTAIVEQLQEEEPWLRGPGDQPPPAVTVTPLQASIVAEFRPAMLVLWAAVGFVLLVACANLANLLLARGAARQRELAIRSAIGADRIRLVRQLLTETTLLGLAGGMAGVVAVYWLQGLLPSVVPPEIPRIEESGIDATVLGFALVLSLVTGMAFGVVPAIQGSRLNLNRALNETSGRSTTGAGILGRQARNLLAVIEVALAMLLLVGAGLLGKSFVRLIDIDPGYDSANVITSRVHMQAFAPGQVMSPVDLQKAAQAQAPMLEALLARVSTLPGVAHAGLVSLLPLSQGEARITFEIEGRPPDTDQATRPAARPQIVSAGYFDAMGLRLVEGRFLNPDDGPTSPPVVVVNETFARIYFPGQRAVGERLRLGGPAPRPFEIVGVAGDVRHQGLTAEPQPEFYLSFRQGSGFPFGVLRRPYLVIQTTGDPVAMLPRLRQTVRDIDPGAPLDDAMTMEARLSASVAQPRFYAVVLGLFALLALVLAATGIYGVLSHTVAQRRMELGVRLALGAQSRQLVAMVLRHGIALIATGVIVGLVAAFGVSRTLASLLFGVAPTDPATFVVVPLLLVVVGLLACYIPARRATRVDPIDALRAE